MSSEKNQSSDKFDIDQHKGIDDNSPRLSEDDERTRKEKMINFLINCAIALALILGFVGFIVFPQVLAVGSILTGCLIASQALSGFGILATLVKTGYAIYAMGWKETWQMIINWPSQRFNASPVQTTLLLLALLGIAIVIGLSATGVIYIPFLTVFAANSMSLEITEIFLGLVSDMAAVSVGFMACYLFSRIAKPIDYQRRGRIEIELVTDDGYKSSRTNNDETTDNNQPDYVSYEFIDKEDNNSDSENNERPCDNPVDKFSYVRKTG